eukprot:CAMPEP_0184368390 /NCGR_PEP_ID=MMETSP1089-20130417/161630_1 /TAXON_ID=38269 ORGANISM="Gloeochaete wittrockiana, Strain SAG46.84" /NCGR_SAMPLE_ID=MMETSP1089 /ASSEMBLY_ACC=CAM_ASM_000445 /LENGTH=301 /DNA_ID=CAMNT_0026710657 /DNA_START=152 /DNA_END=1057 /DNA_ORIENTATION=+
MNRQLGGCFAFLALIVIIFQSIAVGTRYWGIGTNSITGVCNGAGCFTTGNIWMNVGMFSTYFSLSGYRGTFYYYIPYTLWLDQCNPTIAAGGGPGTNTPSNDCGPVNAVQQGSNIAFGLFIVSITFSFLLMIAGGTVGASGKSSRGIGCCLVAVAFINFGASLAAVIVYGTYVWNRLIYVYQYGFNWLYFQGYLGLPPVTFVSQYIGVGLSWGYSLAITATVMTFFMLLSTLPLLRGGDEADDYRREPADKLEVRMDDYGVQPDKKTVPPPGAAYVMAPVQNAPVQNAPVYAPPAPMFSSQ